VLEIKLIFSDYARNWGTNKITIDQNGLNYQGDPDTYTVEYNTNGQSVSIVYSGATKGWIPTVDDDVTDASNTSTIFSRFFSCCWWCWRR
jgi:membrane-bound inhibitor of C-type lysozyme